MNFFACFSGSFTTGMLVFSATSSLNLSLAAGWTLLIICLAIFMAADKIAEAINKKN